MLLNKVNLNESLVKELNEKNMRIQKLSATVEESKRNGEKLAQKALKYNSKFSNLQQAIQQVCDQGRLARIVAKYKELQNQNQ